MQGMMRNKLVWPLFAILIVVMVAMWSRRTDGYTLAGSVIDPPQPAPEIELTDEAGESFRLSALRGKVVLLFFGYTYCPDICPTALKDIQFVFDRMGDRSDEVRFIFITVDPARDDPERLRTYLGGFDDTFTGLTGSPSDLAEVYADYAVEVAFGPAAGTGGYDVEHTSRIFVIDREGLLVETFPNGLGRDVVLADLQHLVTK
jgi:protein SCO1/2